MGIYSNGQIYGVLLVLNEDILYDKKYEGKINIYQLQELKEIYNKINDEDKEKLIIRFYTLTTSTYEYNNITPFLSLFPGNKELLKKLIIFLKYTNQPTHINISKC